MKKRFSKAKLRYEQERLSMRRNEYAMRKAGLKLPSRVYMERDDPTIQLVTDFTIQFKNGDLILDNTASKMDPAVIRGLVCFALKKPSAGRKAFVA